MKQTNRTMLFEEINPDVSDLLMLIGEIGERESLTDDEIQEIHDTLVVHSFDEFIQKFKPCVHMVLDTEQMQVSFSRGHLGAREETIYLSEKDSLFSMLLYIMEARWKKRYVLTAFSDMLENIIPRRDCRLFMEERNKVIEYLKKYDGKLTERRKKKLSDIFSQYDDGIFLLMVFLYETNNMLSNIDSTRVADKGILEDDETMQVHTFKKASKYRLGLAGCDYLDRDKYQKQIGECRQQVSLWNAQLLEDCMMLPVWYAQKEYGTIQRKYQQYCNLYVDVIRRFWVEAKPLMETMLGVKEFFAQYGATEGGMQPALVVGNFRIESMLDQKLRERLGVYLNTVNDKSFYYDTIWYAIVPNVESIYVKEREAVRERFQSRREAFRYRRNRTEEVAVLLEVLADYKIQSFFSLALEEENTFTSFAKKGIDVIDASLVPLEHVAGQDYMIPCFPNFTVIPQEQACINVGKELVFHELEGAIEIQGEKSLWLDEIGIEASYVAAGLVAACQCPVYLKKHFRKHINEELPGVAYRFTQKKHNLVTTSDMLSETTEFSEEILSEAIRKSRGLLFGQKNGKMIVLTDRVFSFHRSNQMLISMVQTVNYIERVIQYETQDYKKNLIQQFFQRRPGSVISGWYGDNIDTINNVLQMEEELQYEFDEREENCTFSIHFKNHDLVRRETVDMMKE